MRLVKYILLLFICSIFAPFTQAQSPKTKVQKKDKDCGCPFDNMKLDESFYNEPLFTADKKPSYVGGNDALYNYTNRLIQNPAKNEEDSSKYNIFCVFVVEKDGSITHPEIVHHSDSIFEKEAIRLITTMPKWNPGRLDNKPVRCWHSISLFFGHPEK